MPPCGAQGHPFQTLSGTACSLVGSYDIKPWKPLQGGRALCVKLHGVFVVQGVLSQGRLLNIDLVTICESRGL